MAQQTAVEWLIEGIHKNMGVWIPTHIQEQAKEMEKQQITFAYNDGADAMVAGKYKSMEDYYNEMYQSRQDKSDK